METTKEAKNVVSVVDQVRIMAIMSAGVTAMTSLLLLLLTLVFYVTDVLTHAETFTQIMHLGAGLFFAVAFLVASYATLNMTLKFILKSRAKAD